MPAGGYLTVKMEQKWWGISVDEIDAVVKMAPISPFRAARSEIVGVMEQAGEAILIVSLALALGQRDNQAASELIVCIRNENGPRLGLAVPSDLLFVRADCDEAQIESGGDFAAPLSIQKSLLVEGEGKEFLWIVNVKNLKEELFKDKELQPFFFHCLKANENLTKPQFSSKNKTALLPFAVVQIGGKLLGIAPWIIKEIIFVKQVTALPLSPAHVKGCIHFKGKALALIDLSPLLKNRETGIADGKLALVCSFESQTVALLIDQCVDLVSIDSAALSLLPEGVEKAFPFVKEIAPYEKAYLRVLDLPSLFSHLA